MSGTHDSDDSGVSLPTKRRTLMGALAAGVGLSALGGATAQDDDATTDDATAQGDGESILAALSGANHGVFTDASGAFHLQEGQDEVQWHLLLEEIEGVTAAHIHEGNPYESGDVVAPLVEYEAWEGDGGETAGEDGAAQDVQEGDVEHADHDEPLVVSGSFSRDGETTDDGVGADEDDGIGGDDNETGVGADDENDTGLGGDDNETGIGGDDNDTGLGGDDNDTGLGGDDNDTGLGGDDNDTGLGSDDSADNASGAQAEGDTDQDVDSETIDDILQNPEDYYVNVHTTQHPEGEIRGQLRSPMTADTAAGADDTGLGGDDNETDVGDDDGIGADDNETDVGDDDTGVGADDENDTGLGGDDNETGVGADDENDTLGGTDDNDTIGGTDDNDTLGGTDDNESDGGMFGGDDNDTTGGTDDNESDDGGLFGGGDDEDDDGGGGLFD